MFPNYGELADRVATRLDQAEMTAWAVADELANGLPAGDPEEITDHIEAVRDALEQRGKDLAMATLKNYVRVARRNPPERRLGVSFTAADEAGAHPDRFRWYQEAAEAGKRLSKREVRRRVTGRGDNPADVNASAEEKAKGITAITRQLGANTDALADALDGDDDARRALAAALEAVQDRQRERVRRQTNDPRARDHDVVSVLEDDLVTARRALAHAAGKLPGVELSDDARSSLRSLLGDVAEAADTIQTLLAGTGFDRELALLLKGA